MTINPDGLNAEIGIQYEHPDTPRLVRGSEIAAGYDFTLHRPAETVEIIHGTPEADEEGIILSHGDVVRVDTGIRLAMPPHLCAVIRSRSGLRTKEGIEATGSRLIDADYRGILFIVLQAMYPAHAVEIDAGDRIAQVTFHPYYNALFQEGPLDMSTTRGEGGFGSTGK